MESRRIFVDTHGFYVWADTADPMHERAASLLRPIQRRFITTEWILIETVNLFVARRKAHWAAELLDFVAHTSALQIVPAASEQFQSACRLWEAYRDHAFPLTDCTSFVVMREFRLKDALTADGHFRVMGFNPMLAD
ncbi:MAG: PIN domain-containing protein [Methylacidiphilales bacterium]|nr:PIN domain-containing protein [Candidatus Methylacidiphilales bacterium]